MVHTVIFVKLCWRNESLSMPLPVQDFAYVVREEFKQTSALFIRITS